MKKVGFIGLGNMGTEMAINLSKAGYNITGYDINQKFVDKLKPFGIKKAFDLITIAKDNDIIITMLPDGKVVEQIYDTIINICNKHTLLVDCSTIDINTAKSLHKKTSKLEISCLDAPVSGGTIGAKNATLTFMVGGEQDSYEKMRPLFEAMGSKSVLCGLAGSGQGIKMCNNLILAITMKGVSESFNLAKKLGLNRQSLFDVVSTSSGSCWSVNNYCPIPGIGPKSPADNNFQAGFSVSLMHKDLSLALEAANECNSNIDFGKLSINLYKEMIDANKGHLDFSAIIEKLQ